MSEVFSRLVSPVSSAAAASGLVVLGFVVLAAFAVLPTFFGLFVGLAVVVLWAFAAFLSFAAVAVGAFAAVFLALAVA